MTLRLKAERDVGLGDFRPLGLPRRGQKYGARFPPERPEPKVELLPWNGGAMWNEIGPQTLSIARFF